MTILNLLKREPDARKIFGRRELKIIEKQLLGIKLTQSEKNRLSRDVRAKLAFISKLSKYNDDFFIKKGTEAKRLIQKTEKTILEDKYSKKILRIILFGSAAENKLTLRSDIDIAVEFDKINLKEATLFRKRISSIVEYIMDIQVYNVLGKNIKEDIDSKGKIIYQK